jgi:hypothetical protein
MCDNPDRESAPMTGSLCLVQLEPGVYLAPWSGDPGRTTRRSNATRFSDHAAAASALAKARRYRAFIKAGVVPVWDHALKEQSEPVT